MIMSDVLAIGGFILHYVGIPLYVRILWSYGKRICKLTGPPMLWEGVQHTMLCIITAVCVVYAFLRIWLQVAMTITYMLGGM